MAAKTQTHVDAVVCPHANKLLQDVLLQQPQLRDSRSPDTVDVAELLALCIQCVQHAGTIIRDVFASGDFKSKDKAAKAQPSSNSNASQELTDPQTIADLRAQHLVLRTLKAYNAQITVIGEEGDESSKLDVSDDDSIKVKPDEQLLHQIRQQLPYSRVATKHLHLWLDPLDGTKEYTLGHVEYVTTLLGIAYQGIPLAGVVSQPFAKPHYRTVYGALGAGAHAVVDKEVTDLTDSTAAVPASRRTITVSRSHFTKGMEQLLDAMHTDNRIHAGGAGSKGLLVLDGDADAYVFPQNGTHRWDTCAVDAIIHSAHGCLTDAYGKHLTYGESAMNAHANDHGVLAVRRFEQRKSYVVPAEVPLSKF